ncbi:MAG: hypothetical protein GX046_06605 [Tissierellia bacterium]|nr:hypothetical protein [Tissierellia bacterium]
MIKNNLKTLIYLGLWYFVLLTSVIFTNFRGLVGGLIPHGFSPIVFYGVATLIYSLIFALLFLKPQGSMMDNFSSMGALVALDIGVILAVALGALFMRYSYLDLLFAIGFCFVQLGMMLGILGLKKS